MAIGWASAQPLTITALDSAGKPVANLPIAVRVFGTNERELSVTTDSQGVAQASYRVRTRAGTSSPRTRPSAVEHQYSNQLEVPWAVPAPPPPAPLVFPERSEPPSVEITSPAGDGVIRARRRDATKFAGEGITGWSVRLTPADGNAMTLGPATGRRLRPLAPSNRPSSAKAPTRWRRPPAPRGRKCLGRRSRSPSARRRDPAAAAESSGGGAHHHRSEITPPDGAVSV